MLRARRAGGQSEGSLVAELDMVLRRRKFNKYVLDEKRLEFLTVKVQKAELEVTEVRTAYRDAVSSPSRASFLLSGQLIRPVLGAE